MEKEPKLVSTWEMMHKDNDGEAHITTLHKYDYEQNADPEHSFLSQAAPTIISSPEIAPRRSKEEITIPLNDIHFGFRIENGVYVPTHSPEALDSVLQLCSEVQPTRIIINGDAIDLPELGRFDLDSKSLVNSTQASLDGLHKFLALLRATSPNAEIAYLEANHEIRASKNLIRNSMPLFGLRKANMPESFAVNSIPFLLRLDELEIEYISGYPANSYDVNDRLKIMHGEFANKPSTAAKFLGMYACSVCFGHTHRLEMMHRTTPDGHKTMAFNPGCLCDTEGSIPSVHNGVDLMGKVVNRNEDWYKGTAIIESKKGDKPFNVTMIGLEETMRHNKKLYKIRKEVADIFRNLEASSDQ